MAHNTHSFITEKLVEIVEDRRRRQDLMVNSLTILGIIFLSAFTCLNYFEGNYALASVLLSFTLWGTGNIYLLKRHRNAGIVSLSCILYMLSLMLIWSGGFDNTGILWVYPIIAISIFINPFKSGVRLTCAFLTIISALFLLEHKVDLLPATYSTATELRFVLTLAALCGMCHILVYFQSKSDEYLLQMHKEDIHTLAYMDSLTGLANRSAFRSVLAHSVLQKKQTPAALMYIDLDNFKPVNDQYGHDTGDLVLAEFGQHLKKLTLDYLGPAAGPYDVGRLGGDEFAVYLSDVSDCSKAENLATEILNLFNGENFSALQGKQHQLSASIGIIIFSPAQMKPAEALNQADRAMYQAKQAGKNDYIIRGKSDFHPVSP